ncbi:Uracil-DNA glycosylase [bioreactor metagenome]|uniref:uracil-DNA glycosylase n=1 Tax=bioreactor metagenome TaxID=1076179 RepID=A0A644U6B1_9ZZZZ|nr:uracil-DNA glycosylase [Bacteroidales bacterium MB20-C3-3]
MFVKIEKSWADALKDEFEKEYFQKITSYLKHEIASGIVVYPKGGNIFKAFDSTPLNRVKVVILGQDPYHGEGQAHGLSFSVQEGVHQPPSLQNIFKELRDDLGIPLPNTGNLELWAQRGVFLLNSVLTVRAGLPASHSKIGWSLFTDRVISILSEKREGVVFMLWGNYARSKRELIDHNKHLVLEAAHPSPLARGAFFGCRHFSKANEYLIAKGKDPVNWSL